VEEKLAKDLVAALRGAGVDFVAYLPETRLSQILPLMRGEQAVDLVPVASEAEAVSIGSGAALGGRQVMVYMEGTGLFVSTYNLIVVAKRFGIPLLLGLAYLGGFSDQRNNTVYSQSGSYLVPLLETLQIRYRVLEDGGNLDGHVRDAVRLMNSLQLPVALVFAGEFSG